MENDIRDSVVSGFLWKFGERILAQGVTCLVTIVLARLLSPWDYGIVSMILIFINIAYVFVTSGFNSALVQNKNATPEDFSTNFYCSLGLSILVCLLFFAAAPFIAEFYSSPELELVLKVFSLWIPLSAFSAIQHAYVERHMIFKKYFFSTLFGTLISGVVGIAMAYKGYGVWALAAQYFTNTIIDILILYITISWRPRLQFSVASAKSMISYGWKVLAADLSTTLFNHLRPLVIGKSYTRADLAFYNTGDQIPGLISTNIGASIMTVLFPAIANVNDDLESVKLLTRRAMKTMAYAVFPMLWGLVVVSKPLICLFLTDKWTPAIPYMQISCLSAAIGLIGTVGLQAMKAIGRSDIVLRLEFYKKPFFILFLIIGVKINMMAVAVTMLLYTILATILNADPLRKEIGYSYTEQLQDLSVPTVLSSIMAILVWFLTKLPIHYFWMLVLQVITGGMIYLGLSYVFKVEAFHYLIRFAKEKLEK